MDKLVLRLIAEGRDLGEIPIERDSSLLGRANDCDVQLPFSGISRRHAKVERTAEGSWKIEDLGSSNRTLVNGVPLEGPRTISRGDRLTLGTIILEVCGDPEPQIDPPPPVTTMFARNAASLQQTWLGRPVQADAGVEAKRVARLKDLVKIAKGLNLAISTESIFAEISEAVFGSLGFVDRLALLVDVRGNRTLELLHHARRPGSEAEEGPEWVSRSVCREVFQNRVAVLSADAQTDERFGGALSLVIKNIRAAMAAPLWNEDDVVGVLYADARIPAVRSPEQEEEDLGFFSALANLAATATQRWLLDSKLKAEEEVRRRLERYHSPAVVQKLVADSTAGRLTPEEREISVLFADIVGFTSLSETLTPGDVAIMLNRFFEEMHGPVFGNGGTLDKYIGDCIMAFFGAPEQQHDHADRAVQAGREMLSRLAELNLEHVFVRPLQIRISVNSGTAVVGDIGSHKRLEYTALGSTVNLASRIEPLCTPGALLIGEATFARLSRRDGWDDHGHHRFKGIDRDIRVFRYTGVV